MTKPTTEALRHGERPVDRVITCDHPINGFPKRFHDVFEVFYERMQDALRTFFAVIREIFDESAYDRFLQRTKVPRSVTSYHDFMQERGGDMTRPRKCC